MGLRSYVLNRLGQMVVTYFAFLAILFTLFRLMPGDPTTRFIMSGLPKEERQRMIEQMGLNDPLYIQFFRYVGNLLQGKLGISHLYNEPVIDVMIIKFWNTVFLMTVSLGLAFLIGIYGGALLAWWRGSTSESLGVVIALVTRSVPAFFSGLLFILAFGIWWQILPTGGMLSPGTEISSFWDRYLNWDFVVHAVMPTVTLTVSFFAIPTLLMRNTMLEVLNADFIDLKEAEGLSPYTVLYKHAVRNSILPIITVVAIVAGSAMGGSVLVETVFNWPGMGRAMVDAVYANDYPLAQATFFIMGSVVIFANFVADLLYGYLDPRISYE